MNDDFFKKAVKMNTRQMNIFVAAAFALLGLCACSGNGDTNAGVNPQSVPSATAKANWNYLSEWINYREMTDTRDGQVYKIVKINPFVVMAENLNYPMPDSYCYDNLPTNCDMYGRLYTWEAAMQACPFGWHLPSADEWSALYTVMGDAPGAMQAKGFDEWTRATDSYGFSALPAAGDFNCGLFGGSGVCTLFWSATEYDSNYGVLAHFWLLSAGDARLNGYRKNLELSVRCFQDL